VRNDVYENAKLIQNIYILNFSSFLGSVGHKMVEPYLLFIRKAELEKFGADMCEDLVLEIGAESFSGLQKEEIKQHAEFALQCLVCCILMYSMCVKMKLMGTR